MSEKIEKEFIGKHPNNFGQTFTIISTKGSIEYPHYIKHKDRKFFIQLSDKGGSIKWCYSHKELIFLLTYLLKNDIVAQKKNAELYYRELDLVTGTKSKFDWTEWVRCISTEKDEEFKCERCGMDLVSHESNQEIYCFNCNKYVWRKK